MIKVGCCGWGYFRPKDFLGGKEFKSVLQAYSSVYPAVEINSTFYHIPKIATGKKWRKEVDDVNKKFEFSVKCNQLVTHRICFTKDSVKIFNIMKELCEKLDARILLLQSPAGFKPSEENIRRMEEFFESIKREKLVLTWEPRGDWHRHPKLIKQVCRKFNLIECVDPFRNEPLYFGRKRIAYFRLHGFGMISMYSYNFSKRELEELNEKVKKIEKKVKEIWVMFNNSMMYKNALEFMKILEEK
jgi:uncharacterized protein YecE (DUF72 family)